MTVNGGVISIVGSATHAANGARGFLLTIEGPAIPEPSTVALLGAGAAIVALRRRRS